MTRESEAQLIDFCLAQARAFDRSAWMGFDAVSRETLAVAARQIAGMDLEAAYQRHSFLSIADELAPEWTGIAELARRTRFDLARFSNLIRRAEHHALAAS